MQVQHQAYWYKCLPAVHWTKHRRTINKSENSALVGELLTKAGMNALKTCTKSRRKPEWKDIMSI